MFKAFLTTIFLLSLFTSPTFGADEQEPMTRFNPNIPLIIENDYILPQLFFSQDTDLEGLTIQIEPAKGQPNPSSYEIQLHLLKPDVETGMSPIFEYADSPKPSIPLVQEKSIGQTFTTEDERLAGFYLAFGTYGKSNTSRVELDIWKLDYPVPAEYQDIDKIERKPIGELCSKAYLQKNSLTIKYREFLRRLLNKPPNLLHYSVGELFIARYPNLCGIEILIGTYERTNKGKLKFFIKEKGISKYIKTIEIDLRELKDNRFKSFSFEPISNSRGKQYYFFLQSNDTHPTNAITGYTTLYDYIPDSRLYINHKPFDTDLVFRPVYDFSGTKRSELLLPALEEPSCKLIITPSDLKDNSFVFLDLSPFNLPPKSNYYMEIVVNPDPERKNPIPLYSTKKNLYYAGSRFEDRKPTSGDLLFIPIYPLKETSYQEIRRSITTLKGERPAALTFKFQPVKESRNKFFAFYLESPRAARGKIAVKTKPIGGGQKNFLYTGGRSTGRSLVFDPLYRQNGSLLARALKYFERLPVDKPGTYTKGFYVLLYALFILGSITMIIFLIVTFRND